MCVGENMKPTIKSINLRLYLAVFLIHIFFEYFFILRKYQYLYLLFILYLLAWILNISLLLAPAFQQFMAPIVAGE